MKSIAWLLAATTCVGCGISDSNKDTDPGWVSEGDDAGSPDDAANVADVTAGSDGGAPDLAGGESVKATAVVDQWVIVGTQDDPICCRDFDGDGRLDNALGSFLAAFDRQEEINAGVVGALGSGQQTLVFTFDGVSSLSSDSFEFSAAKGAWGPNMASLDPSQNEVEVRSDPSNFSDATLTAGVLEARGTFEMPFVVFGAAIWLPVLQATLRATVDTPRSGLPAPGIALVDGTMSGAIDYGSFASRVNEFVVEGCSCLGLGDTPLMSADGAECVPGIDDSACVSQGNDVCASIATNCRFLTTGSASINHDIDIDGDGLFDAMSLGVEFSAAPATQIR